MFLRSSCITLTPSRKSVAVNKLFLAPPVSFVKHYMEKKKMTDRVDNAAWEQIKGAWLNLDAIEQNRFKSKPFKGLTLERRLDAEQKSKVLSGNRS